MSSFSFDFKINDEDKDEIQPKSPTLGPTKPSDNPLKSNSVQPEIRPAGDQASYYSNHMNKGPVRFKESFVDDSQLPPNAKYYEVLLPTEEVVRHFQQEGSSYKDANGKLTDLIPDVYEGGAKTWECSVYLVELLAELYKSMDKELRGLSVLELGCGSALPGLFCASRGANVDFQDYNREVIEGVTIPNYKLNSEGQEGVGPVRFYSGDWSDLHRHLSKQYKRYDIILTSETIYNTKNYMKLSQVFHSVLKSDGIIYLAAKNHYFGVGGGIDVFSQFLYKEECWTIERLKCIKINVNCTILKITRGRNEVLT